MKYSEEIRDLFTVNNNVDGEPYCLAHCISSDFGMFGGIILEFNNRWDMKNKLISNYGNVRQEFRETGGFSIPVIVEDYKRATVVYNLITKEHVMDKPTYDSLINSLIDMRSHMIKHKFNKLAIPLIGCGIDGLDWNIVKTIIAGIFFKDTNIEILVCRR